jgi:hypothetical protein
MSRPWKDRKYGAGEKAADLGLKLRLQQWVTTKIYLLEPDMPLLLNHLYEFAQGIRFGGFNLAFKELGGDISESATALYSIESLSEALCRGLDGDDVIKKSLQETLYFCTEITPELPQPEFGKKLENFVTVRGSKGFIRMFLGVHLPNLIFHDLYEFLAASAPEELRARTEVIEQICQKVATRAVRPLTDWSKPDETLLSTLDQDLNTEIFRA